MLQSLLCSVFPYCRGADTENSKRGSLCQLYRYYLFIALRILRASVSKTLGPMRQILQNTLSQTKFRRWGRGPLGFFSIRLWGVVLRHNLRSVRLFVPLFFSSMCWLNFQFLLHFWIRLRLSKGITCCLCR